MAASGHRLARFARPVDNPAGQADGQAAPAHELAHRDCPPAPQPSPTYPPAPTARPSALLHQVLIFSGGESLRPSACALRLPVGHQVEGGSRLAQRPRSGLALTRLERPQPVRVGAVEGRSPPACPPSLTAASAGVPRGQRHLGQGRRPRSRSTSPGGATFCRRGSRAEGVGEPRRGALLWAPKN